MKPQQSLRLKNKRRPNIKTLCIGDIHNHIEFVKQLLDKYESLFDEVVFVGDYFDSFGDNLEMTRQTSEWLKESITHLNRKHLIGNHDLGYRFFRNQFLRCSGYSRNKADVIHGVLSSEDWKKMICIYKSQGFVFTHAGIGEHLAHPQFGLDYKYLESTIQGDYRSLLPSGLSSPFFSAGEARGGWTGTKGGITWQDWNQEFSPIPGLNQIVGHTNTGGGISYKNYNGSINANIDCMPNWVLAIIDGQLQEIKINLG